MTSGGLVVESPLRAEEYSRAGAARYRAGRTGDMA